MLVANGLFAGRLGCCNLILQGLERRLLDGVRERVLGKGAQQQSRRESEEARGEAREGSGGRASHGFCPGRTSVRARTVRRVIRAEPRASPRRSVSSPDAAQSNTALARAVAASATRANAAGVASQPGVNAARYMRANDSTACAQRPSQQMHDAGQWIDVAGPASSRESRQAYGSKLAVVEVDASL